MEDQDGSGTAFFFLGGFSPPLPRSQTLALAHSSAILYTNNHNFVSSFCIPNCVVLARRCSSVLEFSHVA